jgi:hypothetical protein
LSPQRENLAIPDKYNGLRSRSPLANGPCRGSSRDAIVLPYGFTFDVSDWYKSSMPGSWHQKTYPVETETMKDGTPFYSVLRCAAEEMQRLIAEDRDFDIVINIPEIKTAGYERLHDVLPRAQQMKYEFHWSVRRPYYLWLAGLVLFLIVFRTYRIVRWARRRRRLDRDCRC